MIGEHLAEMYYEAQRAPRRRERSYQAILQKDPNKSGGAAAAGADLSAHACRSEHDVRADGNSDSRAIEQLEQIRELDPKDTESAVVAGAALSVARRHDQSGKCAARFAEAGPE